MEDILDIIDDLFDAFSAYACAPLFYDRMFQRGFVLALIGAFIIGKGGAKLLEWRGRILAFFRPSAIPIPSSRPGPSGMDRATGCMSGTALLFLAFLLIFACAASMIMSSMR